MKRFLSMLLVLAILFTSGCSAAADTKPETEIEAPVPVQSEPAVEEPVKQKEPVPEVVEPEEPVPDEEPETTNDGENTIDDFADISVEKEIFDVSITLPPDIVEGDTQESLDAFAKEKGYLSATLNEDGSATYVMTKSQHKKLMEEMSAYLRQSIEELGDAEEFPHLTKVEVNDNFTKYTVHTTAGEILLSDSFFVMGLYIISGMYFVFEGTDASTVDILVDFVDSETGTLIDQASSANLGEEG